MTILWQFPNLLVSFGDRPNKVWKPYEVGSPSCAPHFWAWPSMSWLQAVMSLGFFYRFWNLCVRISTSKTISVFFITILLLTCVGRWVHPRYTWSRNDNWSPRSTFFCNFAHIFGMFWIFPAIFMSSTYTDKNHCSLRWRYRNSQIPNSDRKDCAPAVLLERQLSTNVVVFLLSVIWSKSLGNPC